MNIRVCRQPTDPTGATLGKVFIDGAFFGFALEDAIRERPGEPVAAWKIAGRTAIPAGRYRVALTFSPRFRRLMPELRNVPGFTGIRIHSGNLPKDTEGCLLLGMSKGAGRVLQSVEACAKLQARIQAELARGEATWIEIENPPIIVGASEEAV